MIHETLSLVHEQVTVPHIVVAIILGFIGRIAWGIATTIGNKTERDIQRFLKQLKTQHRAHGHRAEFDDCTEDNCDMYAPTSANRLKNLRRA